MSSLVRWSLHGPRNSGNGGGRKLLARCADARAIAVLLLHVPPDDGGIVRYHTGQAGELQVWVVGEDRLPTPERAWKDDGNRCAVAARQLAQKLCDRVSDRLAGRGASSPP